MRDRLLLILTLAGKDWRLFLADRRAVVLGFAVPIVLASAFGLVFDRGPEPGRTPRLPMLIVIEDDSPFTHAVVGDLLAGERVEAEVVSSEAVGPRVANRRPGVAVVFPRGFGALDDWKPGTSARRPCILIQHNPLDASEGQWAEGVVSEVVMKRLARDRLAPWIGSDVASPFVVETKVVSGTNYERFNSYTHSFCGMTLQYLLFWGMESGLLLLREQRRSLWLRLQAAPVPLGAILIGKALSTASIALLMVLVTFSFGNLVFGVTITGSWFGFLLLACGASGLAAATGLAVAALGGTEARARSLCILVILGVSMVGGLWLPSFVLPGWARELALAVPTTWAMSGLDGVTWQGQRLTAVLPNVGVIAAFTSLLLAVAAARLVSSEARRRRGLT